MPLRSPTRVTSLGSPRRSPGACARPLAPRELVRQTALLHDLGKLAVPREVLDKPGRLTDAERELIRCHPVAGADVIQGVPALTSLAAAVRAWHERWDGNGYPDRLRGEQIPLAARIVAVCDAFEAMTGDRSYREPKNLTDALHELQLCRQPV